MALRIVNEQYRDPSEEVPVYNSKVCSKCCIDKPHPEFSKRKRSVDGYQYWCKQCTREYKQANKEHINNVNKKRQELKKSGVKVVKQEPRNKGMAKRPTKQCIKCNHRRVYQHYMRARGSEYPDGYYHTCNACIKVNPSKQPARGHYEVYMRAAM